VAAVQATRQRHRQPCTTLPRLPLLVPWSFRVRSPAGNFRCWLSHWAESLLAVSVWVVGVNCATGRSSTSRIKAAHPPTHSRPSLSMMAGGGWPVSWKLVTCLLSMGKMDWARVMSQDSRAWRQLASSARTHSPGSSLRIRTPHTGNSGGFLTLYPHEEDDSGLPAAVLRYRVRNEGRRSSTVSIACRSTIRLCLSRAIAASKMNAATSSVLVGRWRDYS